MCFSVSSYYSFIKEVISVDRSRACSSCPWKTQKAQCCTAVMLLASFQPVSTVPTPPLGRGMSLTAPWLQILGMLLAIFTVSLSDQLADISFYFLSFPTELFQRCLEHFWFCLCPWKHHWHISDRTRGKCCGQFGRDDTCWLQLNTSWWFVTCNWFSVLVFNV